MDLKALVSKASPKLTEMAGKALSPQKSVANDAQPLDRDWVKVSFMVTDDDISDKTDIANRYWSSASSKFTDGRLGCNIGINQRPQWTRYSDIRVKGRIQDRNSVSISNVSGNYGMGRGYSEAIDDPSQRIYLRFGVPQFNSLSTFLMRAFDREQTIMARTGQAPTIWYKLAKAVGTAIIAANAPMLFLGVAAGKAIGWLMGRPTSKFFTLKPTMHLYWATVNTLVNNHAVNVGIFKKILSDEQKQRTGEPYTLDKDQIEAITSLMPDVFNRVGFFDIYALANKAQRLANQMFMDDYERLDKGSGSNFVGYLQKDNTGEGMGGSYISTKGGTPTLAAFLTKMTSWGDYYTAQEGDKTRNNLDPRVDPDAKAKEGEKPPGERTEGGYIENFKKYADAEWQDGSQFAVFRVDHTGSVSEAFGNSTAESELAQKLNGISSQFREARFSLADGNIFGDIQKSIVDTVTNIGLGLADGVTMGFAGLIPGLGGSGYIDVPKHWQSSSVNLPRGSYTIQLISPYNNPISQMINIWIPFFMLLAGAVPRSTGKQSYTHPFYCQIYDKGRLQSRLAMIESLSIQRGTSNLAFDSTGKALAIDVSLSVVDLSSIMHMPMSSGALTETNMTMDEDNVAADYLNVLAGMDLYSQIYPIPQAQLKLTKDLVALKQKSTSPAYHAVLLKNSMEDGFINNITLGASGALSSVLSAVRRGSSQAEGDKR